MGEIVDFKSARDSRVHKRKEVKVKRIRSAFESARKSWELRSGSIESLKALFEKKFKKNKSREK